MNPSEDLQPASLPGGGAAHLVPATVVMITDDEPPVPVEEGERLTVRQMVEKIEQIAAKSQANCNRLVEAEPQTLEAKQDAALAKEQESAAIGEEETDAEAEKIPNEVVFEERLKVLGDEIRGTTAYLDDLYTVYDELDTAIECLSEALGLGDHAETPYDFQQEQPPM